MRNVYSKRLLSSHGGAGDSQSPPAGTVWLVRGLTAFNASAILPETAQLILSSSSITLWQVTMAPETVETPALRVVVNAGETLQIVSGADIDMTVSGYQLSLP
jgi:fermentation-respiration switch protein FrsA (DUF1100 family)